MTKPVTMLQSPPGAEAVIDGRRCLYFGGTAYLGLQSHPEVIRAACEAAQRYGMGAAATRAGFGHQPPTLELEAAAAKYFGHAGAFYFPSGYMGPAIMRAALEKNFEVAFADEQSHFAVFDAFAATGKKTVRFAHRDAADLKLKLQKELTKGLRPLVVCDGVFAATGRLAPVLQFLTVLGDYDGAAMLLDDAHSVGVLGESGRGTFDHFGIPASHVNASITDRPGPRLYACATLSKALGGYGGVVTGDGPFIAHCRHAAHVYTGCTTLPAPVAAASARALELLMSDPTPRLRLRQNAQTLRAGLRRIGLEVDDGPTPVVSLDLGDGAIMERVQQQLMKQHVAIAYLRYAGTGKHGALRIAVFSTHTPEMIGHLVEKLREAL